jgi:dTDP-4-dehydrorhamnose reductase
LNIVIVGRNGQLAWELQRLLPSLGTVAAIGRPEIDLAEPDSIRGAIRKYKPDVIVNAAAYTAVDQAEAERAVAFRVNAEAPAVMAEEARKINALFLTYSTDYVFDGRKQSPYTELDKTNPLNTYGASKLAGDQAVENVGGAYLILRTAWVYGPRGKNFLRTIMRLAVERKELRVVDDQIGAPTSSEDLARATGEIIRQLAAPGDRLEPLDGRQGVYNMTSQGSVSWCGFARAIIQEMCSRGIQEERLAKVAAITTDDYPTPAKRPKNSVLSNEKIRQTFGIALPEWKTSLARIVAAIEDLRTTTASQ